MGQHVLLSCLSLFCLITINAFFTAAEFSIVAVRRSRISQLVKNGDLEAQTVQSFQRGIDRLLSTTQLGITLSSLALGWIGEQTLAVLIARGMERLAITKSLAAASFHSIAIPLAFVCLAYLQIVLGELVPKSLALLYPEKLARFFAPPSLVIAQIFRPFIAVLNMSTRLLLRLANINYTKQLWREKLTAKELQLIINTEPETSDLEASQRELINNVLEFGDVTASEIMVPRTQIEFLATDTTFGQLLTKITQTNYFRYPVIGESLDEIRGIIDYKSLAVPMSQGKLVTDSVITDWIQPPLFVAETKPVKELLSTMQQEKQAMAIVIDRFGGTAGLITLQDLITEIIGDREDPTQFSSANYYQQVDPQTAIMSAQMNIEDVNHRLDLELPATEDYHTLSGFLQAQSQSIPSEGDIVSYENIQFTVLKTDNNLLQLVEIKQNKR